MAQRRYTEDDKAAFLAAFEEHMTVLRACEASGVGRDSFDKWRKDDEAFRESFMRLESAITDKVQELGFKHAGLVPWSDEDKAKGLHRTSDRRMVEVMMRRDQRYRDGGVSVNNTVMALTINGVSADAVKKLLTPEDPQTQQLGVDAVVRSRAIDLKPDEADITPEGVTAMGTVSSILERVVTQREAERDAARAARGVDKGFT